MQCSAFLARQDIWVTMSLTSRAVLTRCFLFLQFFNKRSGNGQHNSLISSSPSPPLPSPELECHPPFPPRHWSVKVSTKVKILLEIMLRLRIAVFILVPTWACFQLISLQKNSNVLNQSTQVEHVGKFSQWEAKSYQTGHGMCQFFSRAWHRRYVFVSSCDWLKPHVLSHRAKHMRGNVHKY